MIQNPFVEVIEKNQFMSLIYEGHKLIDVRSPEEYKDGHIYGSQNININSIDFINEIQKLDNKDTILVYCRSGRRSLYASQVMVAFGFKKIYDLKGWF